MSNFYTAKIKWYNEFENKTITEVVIVFAVGFTDATKKLENQYGGSIEEISDFRIIGQNHVICLGENDNRAEIVIDTIEEYNSF